MLSSDEANAVLTHSRQETIRLGHDHIGVKHLLLGIISEGTVVEVWHKLRCDIDALKDILEQSIEVTGTPASGAYTLHQGGRICIEMCHSGSWPLRTGHRQK